ncbi:MAG: cupin-like domain-containing protein [Rhizobiales bacterium]|nr:cupin-like domain-containing protein [Hyphomicrobiales bacterium]MBO6697453.1 cupin-like domain-containing protein [Hyphomicrobiales bacterium]MBO6736292.1 cupin-like domain-containing protein [Hyphomicrobiales bacterium]MBO6912762.1 cupin-like domain-containing protein [Hyphomicrobiales bacterium]MBO6953931.1 cupin-like domain-containing protein [Hyphomicrobiales bacterium]
MIFKEFTEQDKAVWGGHTVKLNHTLHEHALFSNEALMALVDAFPRSHYNLNTMAEPGAPKAFWREGEKGDASGAEVFEAIEKGRMWINLRRVMEVDDRYAALLDEMFDEMQQYIPDFETFKRNMGILVSSPGAQVYYHCDIPGQSLWQVRGRKKVYLYPNSAPFLPEPEMEKVILGETEEEINYEPWFDDYAQVIELAPGEMLHWPLNAPHRVENLDMLNISITTEHFTADVRTQYAVRYANGILRSRFGLQNLSPRIDGPMVYPKMALAAAFKFGGLQKARAMKRMVDFRITKDAPEGIVDIPAYAL